MSKDVVVKLKLEKQGMVKGLADVQAGFSLATTAAKGLASMVGEVISTGERYSNLLKANTTDISKAAMATKGLVDNMQLLTSANLAASMNLGLSSDQFAELSKAAVIMSQRIGIDSTKAIEDLITGLSRQSKVILDNLGIVVSVGQANREYAESLGVSTTALTDAQKKEAFMAATMREVNRLTAGQEVQVKNAGAAWTQFKTTLSNTGAQVSKFASREGGLLHKVIGGWEFAFRELNKVIERFTTNLDDVIITTKDLKNVVVDLNREYQTPTETILKMMVPTEETERKRLIRSQQRKTKKQKSRGRKRGVAGVDYTPSTVSIGREDVGTIEEFEDMRRQKEILPVLNEMLREYDTAQAAATITQMNATKATYAQAEADMAAMQAKKSRSAVEMQWASDVNSVVLGTVHNLATGLFAAADAAIQGGISWEGALVGMLKATAFNISSTAAAHAIKMAGVAMEYQAMAANPYGGQVWYPAVAAAWASVGKWALIAGGAGIAGIGLSIAQREMQEPEEEKERKRRMRDRAARPSFGRRRENSRPIIVNAYFGSPDDPTAILLATQKVQGMMRAA